MAEWRFSTVSIAHLLSAAISFTVAGLLVSRRRQAGGGALLGLAAAAGWWAFTIAFELAATSLTAKILLSKVSYLGVVSAPVFFLLFALGYVRPNRPLGPRILLGLWAVPVASLLLAWTNEAHGLIWTTVELDSTRNVALYRHGAAFYVMIAYLQAAGLAAIGLLVAPLLRAPGPYRRQTLRVLLGVPWPFLASLLYVSGVSPIPGVDATPLAFVLTGILLANSLLRHGLLDLVPVARDAVFDQIQDGILVTDRHGRVVEANRAATRMLGAAETTIGQHAGPLVCAWIEALRDPPLPARAERLLTDPPRHLDLQAEPLRDGNGEASGWLLVFQDVTLRREAEIALASTREALAERVSELEGALARIRTLQGLLPICSYCRRIRDEDDRWHKLETYLSERTDTSFSHGVCPDCYERELAPGRELRAASPSARKKDSLG